MISHIGSMVGVVSGMLFARRMQGRLGDSVGAVTLGEGGLSTGAFHEGVNMAAVERLPLIVAVTNNQFAYSTTNDRQFACASLVDRAKGYGIAGRLVDGTDLIACVETLRDAVQAARQGGGPQLIIGNTLRLTGHGEHDDASYIPDTLRHSAVGRDCLVVAEQQLLEHGWATEAQVKLWRSEHRNEVERVVASTNKEAGPDPFKEDWRALSTASLCEGQWTT
jgi:pyruvate dehydrogenase E1 component alpha subunit/2-oxoisovalerate dehydrogenase E1 component alpha subunit